MAGHTIKIRAVDTIIDTIKETTHRIHIRKKKYQFEVFL